MSSISNNLQAVHEAIAQSATCFGRNVSEIALLAVSKTFSAQDVLEAWHAGQRSFGENYLQEAVEKIAQVQTMLQAENVSATPEWHFIGPIQSNKTRQIAEHFSWVHTVAREKIAQRLSEQRPAHLGDLNVCIQVNISDEDSKSGCDPHEVLALALTISALPRLKLRGLMAVPKASLDVDEQRKAFRSLARLKGDILAQGIAMDVLSMGMSADLPAAVAEGSTMLRVGSAIFGKRIYV